MNTSTVQSPKTAIIIPAYNEAPHLLELIERVIALRGGQPWEIIVVDDGSTDQTPEVLRAVADRVRVIRHSGNFGYGASLKTGIHATRARDVIFLDADGQHDPAYLAPMTELLDRYEFVIGMRRAQEGVPLIRRPGKLVLKLVVSFLVGRWIEDVNFGFRGGRRSLYLRMLDLLPDGYSFSTTSLVYVLKSRFTAHLWELPSKARKGVSMVRMFRDGFKTLLLVVRLIMLFDPLRAFGVPALVLIGIGLLYQVYILVYKGLHVEGGAILSILAGIVLVHFALLADQLAAMRKEMSAHASLIEEQLSRPNQ